MSSEAPTIHNPENHFFPDFPGIQSSHMEHQTHRIAKQKNYNFLQPINFTENQKLLKSVHGARRTTVWKSVGVLGGGSPSSTHLLLEILYPLRLANHVFEKKLQKNIDFFLEIFIIKIIWISNVFLLLWKTWWNLQKNVLGIFKIKILGTPWFFFS